MAADRAHGEGWDVWVEEDILWARERLAQHGLSAAAQVEALERLLALDRVKGVLVDAREPRGATPAAREAYARLLARHPEVPFAYVTADPDGVRAAFALRSRAGTANLRVFRSPAAAKAWIRSQRGAGRGP